MFIVKCNFKTKESNVYIQMKCMTPTWISEYIVDSALEYYIPTRKSITAQSYHTRVKFNLPKIVQDFGIGFTQDNTAIE